MRRRQKRNRRGTVASAAKRPWPGQPLMSRGPKQDPRAAPRPQGLSARRSPHLATATLQEKRLLLPFRLQNLTRVPLWVNSNSAPFKGKDSGKCSSSLADRRQAAPQTSSLTTPFRFPWPGEFCSRQPTWPAETLGSSAGGRRQCFCQPEAFCLGNFLPWESSAEAS